MARKDTKMDFASILGKGENPKGFCGETVNGSTRSTGSGWNKQFNYDRDQVPAEGVWNNKGNRTGE